MQLVPRLVREQNIPYLWPVAVGDHDVVIDFQQVQQVLARFIGILLLLIDSPLLASLQQGITTKRYNGKLFHDTIEIISDKIRNFINFDIS